MKKLAYEDVKFALHADFPRFTTTGKLKPCTGIIGQERATRAIRMGLEMSKEGYNIFISGIKGTGRSTTIKMFLDQITSQKNQVPEDKVFVHNFNDPSMPICLRLEAGCGQRLRKDMHNMVRYFIRVLPHQFEDVAFKNERNAILEKAVETKRQAINDFETKAKSAGFTVVEVRGDGRVKPTLVPLLEDKPVDFSKLDKMVQEGTYKKEDLDTLRKVYRRLVIEMEGVLEAISMVDEKSDRKIEQLVEKTVEPPIKRYLNRMKRRYKNKRLHAHLDILRTFIIRNPQIFFIDSKNQAFQDFLSNKDRGLPGPFIIFEVNVLVDNGELKSPPVIIENAPTLRNIFGTIEKSIDTKGRIVTNFTHIKSGSLIRADGGYLVIDCDDMIHEPLVYHLLKRTLKTRELTIQAIDPVFHTNVASIKPESIPIDTKVILYGGERLYQALNYADAEFGKIFKIKAQFNHEIDNTLDNQLAYASFVRTLSQKSGLRSVTFKGFEQIVRYGCRMSGNMDKLTTVFTDIADIIREADYFARMEKKKTIDAGHITQAIANKQYMYNLPEEKILEYIQKDIILINTKAEAIGEINGLVVYSIDKFAFGRPARITVSISMGDEGIVNIEREAELSGSSFDKAVMIIDGYLRKLFAQDKPLSVNISLAFEQSYGLVEGDSASQAEIIAILSALSNIPIKQYIAITGSVNQLGEVQPIGGVNEKIEGFFKVCLQRGLTGNEGVIIPARNQKDLILNDDVLQAVKKGGFNIWAVDRIEESIEIMMGRPAGTRKKGGFKRNSVYDVVDRKLRDYALRWKKWSGEGSDGAQEKK